MQDTRNLKHKRDKYLPRELHKARAKNDVERVKYLESELLDVTKRIETRRMNGIKS